MKNFYRSVFVLCAVICFAAGGFLCADRAAAQVKTSAKPTPKPQKSPAKPATPAKKNAASSNSAKKTTATTKTADKNKTAGKNKSADKSKTAAKFSTDKNKSSAKGTSNSKDKTTATKSSAKVSPTVKSAAAKTATAKTASMKTAASAKSANEKATADSKQAAKPAAAQNVAASSSQIIVAATSARLRSAPDQNAGVVSTLTVGKIFPVAEENSSWYRVRLANDKGGWISKQVAIEFTDAKRAEIYQKIVAKYFKGKMDFATAAQIYEFLTGASGEVKNQTAQGDLNLKRLQALGAALKAVPFGKGETENPYKTFLKTHEKEVVYSEPSGEWYVRSDVFWETHARYKDLPVGEEIAWLAAQTPLPGECEGYVNCYIYLLRVTDGEYLNFYPGGKYARKSVQNITAMLDPIVADLKGKTVYTAATDISDRAEFNRLLTELRQIISKVPFVEKAKAVQQINQIGEGFR